MRALRRAWCFVVGHFWCWQQQLDFFPPAGRCAHHAWSCHTAFCVWCGATTRGRHAKGNTP